VPVDAQRWLAERGIRPEPLVAPDDADTPPEPAVTAAGTAARTGAGEPATDAAGAVATEDSATAPRGVDPVSATHGEGTSDEHAPADPSDVQGALAFIRRSTANAPQSEGRLRTKLLDRTHPEHVIDAALELAREERLVDDRALLAALIVERRARGHADARLRRDLRDRGFTGAQVDAALAQHQETDPAAAAFALAREVAARHRALDAEVAVRRTVGNLVRRGHGEGLARKAARDAVYADRESQRTAEH
jgi:SOS response regulatory protein OraA/RecX